MIPKDFIVVKIEGEYAYLREMGANENDDVYHFFLGGIDAYRYYVNEDFSGNFFPAKNHLRSETVDFQRGEVEWKGENLYFGRWKGKMKVEYL